MLLFSPAPAAQATASGDLRISISVVESEHSKDSNSSSTTFVIKSNDLVYDRSYAGHHTGSAKPTHQHMELTRQELDLLKRLISREGLLVSRSLGLAAGAIARQTTVAMNIRLGNKSAHIRVSGPVSSIENKRLYRSARALIDEINNIRETRPVE